MRRHLLAAAVAVALTARFASGESLVPAADTISNADARAELAAQLSLVPGRESEALAVTNALLADGIGSATAHRRLRASVLQRIDRNEEALTDLRWLAKNDPADTDSIVALANLLAAQGRAHESRTWFEQIAGPDAPDDLQRLYGAQMQGWGDFRRALAIIDDQLRRHGPSTALLLERAAALRGAQRFIESAETYHRVLAREPRNRSALNGLALTQLLARDYAAAETAATRALAVRPTDTDARSIRAQARFLTGDLDAAAADFQKITTSHPGDAWIGLGRIAAARGDDPAARAAFARARSADPLAAGYHLQSLDSTAPPTPLAEATPAERTRWANLLLADGFGPAAHATFEAALARDPEFFPAALGRVDASASAKDYPRALAELDQLRDQFPENAKLDLTRARILSWSKDYDASATAYETLIASDPTNPLPRRELARILAWDKRMRAGTRAYASLWQTPVDETLRTDLPPAIANSLPRPPSNRPFALYESLANSDPDPATQAILARHRATYLIQKTAWLESRAKNAAWNKHFLRAEDELDNLVALEPGNQEAWFDRAQAQAVQGLGRRAIASYETLLTLDPLHQQASLALDRERLLSHPAVSLSYLYLNEDGADRFADITRQRVWASFELPIQRDYFFRVHAMSWIEQPANAPLYFAEGPRLEAGGVFNEYLSGSASFVFKNYADPAISDTFGGSASLTFNAGDFVRLTALYERADVIHNEFAIKQSTQADSLQLEAHSFINRWFDLRAQVTGRFYNDNNSAFESLFTAGFLLLDHPHSLKFLAGVEFRNTRNLSEPVFVDAVQTDVIHPYWTPQNYLRGLLALEWRHDLGRFFFANAESHHYLLRLRGSTDSTNNPSVGFDAEYRLDFARQWSLNVSASVERSPQWNGAAAFSSLTFRF